MSLSTATACALWCPEYFNKPAVIDFWLNHPAVPDRTATATRAALPSYMPARMAQCWLDLYNFLNRARTRDGQVEGKQVTALLEELRESGVVTKEERLDLKPKLLRSTPAEFTWHAERIRSAVDSRRYELEAQHEEAA